MTPHHEVLNETYVNIRAALPHDAEQIAFVLRAAFHEFESQYTPAAFQATLPSAEEISVRLEEGPIWIAECDETLVGTVSAAVRPDEIYIRSMAVLPTARGRGIATRLLEAVESFAVTVRSAGSR